MTIDCDTDSLFPGRRSCRKSQQIPGSLTGLLGLSGTVLPEAALLQRRDPGPADQGRDLSGQGHPAPGLRGYPGHIGQGAGRQHEISPTCSFQEQEFAVQYLQLESVDGVEQSLVQILNEGLHPAVTVCLGEGPGSKNSAARLLQGFVTRITVQTF